MSTSENTWKRPFTPYELDTRRKFLEMCDIDRKFKDILPEELKEQRRKVRTLTDIRNMRDQYVQYLSNAGVKYAGLSNKLEALVDG